MRSKCVSKRIRYWRPFCQTCAASVALAVFAVCTVDAAVSQEPSLDTSPVKTNNRDSSRSGSFVVAPIPTASPAVGNGLTLLGGYIFPLGKSDKVSPPSILGGAWVGTDNGTRAWVAAAELYFAQDRYHVVSGVAHGDLNYEFYGTGTAAGDAGRKFDLNQTGDVVFAEAMRRTIASIFIGPRLWFGSTRIAPQHPGETHPGLPPFQVDFSMRSLGFKIERDTRDNRFYPEKGTMLTFGSDFFAKDLGGSFTFQRYRLTFNDYRSLSKKQVLAYNLFGCSTGGDAPFFGQCIFGMGDELRGYPAGRYIDRKMFAAQLEYRRTLPWRLGVAAFGGLGEVAPTFSDFNASSVLPSGGLGPRLTLSNKYHVNLRADFAWGKEGHTFSMGLGESF